MSFGGLGGEVGKAEGGGQGTPYALEVRAKRLRLKFQVSIDK